MKNRQLRAPRKNTDRILSGLLVCGKCGQPYTIASYYQKQYPYYRCTTRKSQGKVNCDNRGLRGDKLDKFIISVAMKRIFAPENFENYKQVIDDSVRQERQQLLQVSEDLTQKLDEIKSKKQVYYDGLESGQLEMKIVSERLKALQGEEEKLLEKQAEVDETLLSLPDSEDYVLSKKEYAELKSTLDYLLDKSEPSRIRSFLQTFIKGITVNSGNIEIAYSLPALHQKKGPAPFITEGQSLSVLELASPTGFEPVSLA
ncbi:MAG: recombinase zinc beta ribbon domain-containing protein [Desulfarculaceae bacterium]|nr:recombinase zinc beta ribbon domain-containing protein [Desulfarculaceae bacterium]